MVGTQVGMYTFTAGETQVGVGPRERMAGATEREGNSKAADHRGEQGLWFGKRTEFLGWAGTG